MEGWIKLHRKLLISQFGKNLELMGLFSTLLLMANHKEGFTADGTKIMPGQFMTSQKELAKRFKMDRAKLRRLLEKLNDAKQIEQQTSTKNTVITIVNWSTYQGDEHQANIKRTSNEHQANTNKNANNNKNNILSISTCFLPEFFSDVIDEPKKNLPASKPKGKRKSKNNPPEPMTRSPLSVLFPNELDPIHEWLLTGTESVQNELLTEHSHHVLASEIKTAFQWQLERSPREAGLYLKNWMKNKKKHDAYGLDDEKERGRAAREFYKSKFGCYPEEADSQAGA